MTPNIDEEKVETSINRFIVEVREFSQLSDDQIRQLLRRIAAEKPNLFEIIAIEAERKTLKEIKKMIKEIKASY